MSHDAEFELLPFDPVAGERPDWQAERGRAPRRHLGRGRPFMPAFKSSAYAHPSIQAPGIIWTPDLAGSTCTCPAGDLTYNGDAAASAELFEFEALEFEDPAQPILRLGSRGNSVRDLQQRLLLAGHSPGPVDGIFGSQTDRAVRAYQRSRGLSVDGIVGPQTWGALASLNLPRLDDSKGTTRPQWQLPDSVRQAGEHQYVRYDSPPAWTGQPGNCSGTFTTGARILKKYLEQKFHAISEIGGYSCRKNSANSKETSVHGVGRALDIHFPMVSGMANSQAGDPVANWLVEHAQEIGIQYIIWNRTKWNGSTKNGRKDGRYGGPNPHIDHIHAELNLDAAARRTPWFKS
jgi:peptidoglycan hydrolase-like protein with peptidoglycan-binding domain